MLVGRSAQLVLVILPEMVIYCQFLKRTKTGVCQIKSRYNFNFSVVFIGSFIFDDNIRIRSILRFSTKLSQYAECELP